MRENINNVLDSGQISYGNYSKRLEREFSDLHGCKYGVLSNSGTSSLQVALQTLKELHGWKDGSRVIVPATTFVATANIVRHCSLVPCVVDVDALTYNIDIRSVSENVDDDTVAIIPVHMFGQPSDMTSILNIAHANGLHIVEDSCETMFATHFGKPVGSIGDIGCFSMYVAHILVGGVGGLSITSNPDYAAKMRSLVNHGLSISQLNVDDYFSPMPMMGRSFQFDTVGYSYRITEFEAAVAVAQLEDWKDIIRIRRRNAHHLTARLSMLEGLQCGYVDDGNTHAWMMFPIVLFPTDTGALCDKSHMTKYLNQRGIQTRDMPSLLYQPAYKMIDPCEYPVSDWIAKNGFYVGCHQDLTPDDMDYVADCISEYVDENKIL
jgi:dTDP-4-amino-4,6-dideoxygalactose transaminase